MATTEAVPDTEPNDTVDAAAAEGADDPGLGDEGYVDPADAEHYSSGWFKDTAAWPHVVVWGVLLSLIAVGGHLLGRRLRRRWLGALAAAAPFVVVLYFFFQNVNRLLPPGL